MLAVQRKTVDQTSEELSHETKHNWSQVKLVARSSVVDDRGDVSQRRCGVGIGSDGVGVLRHQPPKQGTGLLAGRLERDLSRSASSKFEYGFADARQMRGAGKLVGQQGAQRAKHVRLQRGR